MVSARLFGLLMCQNHYEIDSLPQKTACERVGQEKAAAASQLAAETPRSQTLVSFRHSVKKRHSKPTTGGPFHAGFVAAAGLAAAAEALRTGFAALERAAVGRGAGLPGARATPRFSPHERLMDGPAV